VAEKIVLDSSGTSEFADMFYRLQKIEGKLRRAKAVDQDLLHAVIIAEIMLKLPAGDDGKQMMSVIKAMVTSGQLSYKQAIQLRDSLSDISFLQSSSSSSTVPTSSTDSLQSSSSSPTVKTSSTDEAALPTEKEMPQSNYDQADTTELKTSSTSTTEAPTTSIQDKSPKHDTNDADAYPPAAAELKANESKEEPEGDTDSGLSEQTIIIITVLSILILGVAGVVAVAAVRRSRRRSNAAERVSTSIDPLPVPPVSSAHEHTAIVVDESAYIDVSSA